MDQTSFLVSLVPLRVFEPRYKQMMDDCIMDSKPFGYISADPAKGELNGLESAIGRKV